MGPRATGTAMAWLTTLLQTDPKNVCNVRQAIQRRGRRHKKELYERGAIHESNDLTRILYYILDILPEVSCPVPCLKFKEVITVSTYTVSRLSRTLGGPECSQRLYKQKLKRTQVYDLASLSCQWCATSLRSSDVTLEIVTLDI